MKNKIIGLLVLICVLMITAILALAPKFMPLKNGDTIYTQDRMYCILNDSSDAGNPVQTACNQNFGRKPRLTMRDVKPRQKFKYKNSVLNTTYTCELYSDVVLCDLLTITIKGE